jgi:hypothetical protein
MIGTRAAALQVLLEIEGAYQIQFTIDISIQ